MTTPHPIPYQGSKRRLARAILARFPERPRTLFEPFAGSAAVTLAAAAGGRAMAFALSDSLPPLATIWRTVVDDPAPLAEAYEALWTEGRDDPRGCYERTRARFNEDREPAALLYLLARCVKNAVRWNSAGEFNQSADHRRLGMRPDRMRTALGGAHALLRGRTRVVCADYAAAVAEATARDVVYLDPPYQGTSAGGDRRYHEGLELPRFVATLEGLRRRSVPFLVSFDGRTGARLHGQDLPRELGLRRFDIDAGRSSQATLLGRDERTVEALYASPELA